MLTILSPAKNLNMEKASNTNLYTSPVFIKEASTLIKELVNYSPPEMESLMKINSELAEENFFRHISWDQNHNLSNAKQALMAYNGAVFQGIRPSDFSEEQLAFANNSLRILSGLYGALRPLDLIKPYRLEMAAKLKNDSGSNLYSFWRDKLTDYFKEELIKQNSNVIIDLASKEYSSAVDMFKINANVITPIFKDYKRGAHKVITIYAKRARGLMSRFIIENNIVSPNDLKEFNDENYSYNEYLSSEKEWVFIR